MQISIDISEFIQNYSLTQNEAKSIMSNVVRGLAVETFQLWEIFATQNLKSTRNQYISGLQVINESELICSVVLIGTLNNMIESGVGAYDMKNGFSKSPKVKYNKNGGWYLTIPFRFSTPGAIGESSVFSNQLPQAIYSLVKNLQTKQTQIDESLSKSTQLSKNSIPEQYAIPKVRGGVSNLETKQTFDTYINKSSIFEGLQKSSKTYQNATQSQYVSFRRVGANSDSNAFIHSGITAYELADKAIQKLDIATISENIIDNSLKNLGK